MVSMNRLIVPSGRIYYHDDIALLTEANACGSIVYGEIPFKLKSLIESHVYVFCRGDFTDNPILLGMCGHKVARTVIENTAEGDHQANLIGLPTAGTALAVATSMESVSMHRLDSSSPLIASRVMREQLKESHGANNRWVNGEVDAPPDLNRFTYWALDNVVTNGKTKFEAAERFEQDGYKSLEMPQLIFIDRQQGAVKRLEVAGFKRIVVCYYLLDITYLYSELGIWPKEVVKLVEKEIKAHQFL